MHWKPSSKPSRASDIVCLFTNLRYATTCNVINNIRVILEEYGAGLENVVDVLVFLIDMDRDFKAYNEVYAEHFGEIMPARTTVSINALPSPIAIEMKVIAKV